jgi:hypothetical protein
MAAARAEGGAAFVATEAGKSFIIYPERKLLTPELLSQSSRLGVTI